VASTTAMTRVDVEAVRAQFPALGRRHRGAPVAYFDGPGGTQVPQRVTDAMTDYLLHHNANTAWAYPTSIETDEMIAGARAAFGDLQIFGYAQITEDGAILRHEADALRGDLKTAPTVDRLPGVNHFTLTRRRQAQNRFERRRLARTVAPQQRRDTASGRFAAQDAGARR